MLSRPQAVRRSTSAGSQPAQHPANPEARRHRARQDHRRIGHPLQAARRVSWPVRMAWPVRWLH